MAVQPNLSRLKTQLAQTNLAKENNPLFQVINQIIDFITQSQAATTESIASSIGGVPNLSGEDFLTHSNESVALPNSRQLKAGTNITFDDTVANERTVAAAGSAFPAGLKYLTSADESVSLPSSRELLAGAGIIFDDTVANERTVSLDPSTASPKGAQVYRSTDLTVTDATPTIVNLTTEVVDEDNYWDIANPSRIVIPSDGWYVIIAQAATDETGSGAFNVSIKVDGTTIRNGQTGFTAAVTNDGLKKVLASALLNLTAGQYVEMSVEINIAGASSTIKGGQNNTFVQIVRAASSVGGDGGTWSVLTDGDLTQPELIFASGDVIMIHVP